MSNWQSIDKPDLLEAVSMLQKNWDVIAPVERGGVLRLRKLPAEGEMFLGMRKPLLPLKTWFLPEVEELFTFTVKDEVFEIAPAEPLPRQRVVIGALGCDVAALEVLDRLFLEEPEDTSYRKRREETTVIALACTGEGPECFCTSFGIDPLAPSGADALLADVGEALLLKAVTEKGEQVFEALRSLVKEPTEAELNQLAALVPEVRGDVPVGDVARVPIEIWDHPLWDELAALCLGCGVCTVICPTCHCFDVEDERRGCSGSRIRAWDSCMGSCFTKMASGENPRPTRRERVRQRFLHKLSYYPERSGVVSCTGCGRCLGECPVGIGIEEVIFELAGVKVERG